MSAIWVPSKLSELTGNIVAVSPTSSTKTVVVRGAPSQTANLQEWQNSSGTNLSKLDAAGNLIVRGDRGISSALVGGVNTPQIFVQNYSASDIAAVVKGATSQSANLQEWQDSSGTALAYVASDGLFYLDRSATATNIYAKVKPYDAATPVWSAAIDCSGLNMSGTSHDSVHAIGWNLGANMTPLDNTKHMFRDAWEYKYEESSGVFQTERHVGAVVLAGSGSEIRPLTMSVKLADGSTGVQVDAHDSNGYFGVVAGAAQVVKAQVGSIYLYQPVLCQSTLVAGATQITSGSNSQIPLVVKGAASQGSAMFEILKSDNTLLSHVDPNGVWYCHSGNLIVNSDVYGTNAVLALTTGAGSAQIYQDPYGNLLTNGSTGSIYSNSNASWYWRNATSAVVMSMSQNGGAVHTATHPATKPLVVQGASSQTANLQEWQDSNGTVLNRVSADGKTYWGIAELNAAHNFYNGYMPRVAAFQCNAAAAGEAVVSVATGNLVSGDYYVINAGGWSTGNAYMHVHNSGSGDAVMEVAAYGSGGAYVRACVNGGQAWAAGLDRNVNGYKISAYGVPGIWDVAAITPTGGTTLTSLAAATKPLTIVGAPSQTANLQEWQNSSGTATSSVDKSGYICVPTGSGAPATNPTSGGGLYYDTTGNALYAWNGSAWKSVNLT